MFLLLRAVQRVCAGLPGSRCRFWGVFQLGRRRGHRLNAPRVSLRTIQTPTMRAAPEALDAHDTRWDAPTMAARFAAGNELLLAEEGGCVIAGLWLYVNKNGKAVDLRRHADLRVGIWLPPGWGYFWDGWTLPAARGRGVMRLVGESAHQMLCDRGCAAFITVVDLTNRPSLRCIGDFERVAVLRHVRLLGRDLIRDELHLKEERPPCAS